MKTIKKRFTFLLLSSLIVVSGLTLINCDGSAGAEGPQGPQGPQGPIGPAGENGSVIHAGQGAPEAGIGNPGDYYLDTQNSLLYGPKTEENSWGTPIDLKGADGQDGQDGADGQDGEDGSQIFSGTTAPTASLGDVGDFYLNTSNFNLYGPKTGSGWGTPINLQGNANVTLYIFDGHDFTADIQVLRTVTGLSESDFLSSSWVVYLVELQTDGDYIFYPIPRSGGIFGLSDYSYASVYSGLGFATFDIRLTDGPGETYEEIRIIRTAASNVVDNRTSAPKTASPKGYKLDQTNYEEVAKYYGFSENNTVRISNQ